ncbi:hypothetical protein D3C80_1622930 [compost metagenome]
MQTRLEHLDIRYHQRQAVGHRVSLLPQGPGIGGQPYHAGQLLHMGRRQRLQRRRAVGRQHDQLFVIVRGFEWIFRKRRAGILLDDHMGVSATGPKRVDGGTPGHCLQLPRYRQLRLRPVAQLRLQGKGRLMPVDVGVHPRNTWGRQPLTVFELQQDLG